jgi:hypothetical protein
MQRMHARSRVKLRVSRRFRLRGAALAAVALGFGEPLGRLLLLLQRAAVEPHDGERTLIVEGLSTSTAVNPAVRARTASRAPAQILWLHRESRS